MNSLNRDMWEERVKLQVNNAWSRGANWACKGRGYALDTDADREAETIIELINNLIQEAKAEEKEVRITRSDDNLDGWYECPECLKEGFDSSIRDDFIFCPWCGAKVKWLDQAISAITNKKDKVNKK